MPLVSDIITLSNFAYKLYHRLSDVPQLNHVRNNLRILRFELDNLISERKNQSSIASAHWVEHEEMLQSVVDGVEEDVIRLNDTLEKYGVSTGNTPTCIQKTKIAWHSQKIEKLNNCLESHKNSFALLRTAMNSSALEEIRPHHRDDDDDSLDPILSADIKSPFDLDKQAEMDDEEEEEEEEEMGIKEDEIGIEQEEIGIEQEEEMSEEEEEIDGEQDKIYNKQDAMYYEQEEEDVGDEEEEIDDESEDEEEQACFYSDEDEVGLDE